MVTGIVDKGHVLRLKMNRLMFSMRSHPLYAHGELLIRVRPNIKNEQAHLLNEESPLICPRELLIRGTSEH